MKRIYTLVISLAVLLPMMAANSWGLKGEGTEANPYIISSPTDFDAIAHAISATDTGLGEYFIISEDIDFGGSESNPVQLPAIGKDGIVNITTMTYGFEGTLDGQNHKISGIYHTNNSNDANGKFNALFAAVGANGVIKNVCLDKDNSISAYNYAAAIASVCKGSISNCQNYADITAANAFAGGICGYLSGATASIDNCLNEGNIRAMTYASGIVAGSQNVAGIMVSDCVNNGNISTVNGLGSAGIMGTASGTIRNCVNNGCIDDSKGTAKTKQYTGGIAACGNYSVNIEQCTNNGNVMGGNNIGGIIGHFLKGDDSNVSIDGCVNNASVSGDKNVAGIAGNTARVNGVITLTGARNNGVITCAQSETSGNLTGNGKMVIGEGWYIASTLSRLPLDPIYDGIIAEREECVNHYMTEEKTSYAISGMQSTGTSKGIFVINGRKIAK